MAADTTLQPTAAVVAGTHYLHFAPLGTTLPTDVPATGGDPGDGIDTAFLFAGATADSGSAFSIEAQTTDLYVSQTLDVYRTIIQSRKASVTAPLVDWTGTAITTSMGGGTITTTTNGYKFEPPASGTIEEVSAVLTIVDGEFFYRFVVERGLVSGSASINLVKTAFATLPISYTALAPTTQATAWVLYSNNPALSDVVGS